MPCDVELVDPIAIEYPNKPIPTFIVLCLVTRSLFHSFMDPLVSALLALETCVMDATNFDQAYELSVRENLME